MQKRFLQFFFISYFLCVSFCTKGQFSGVKSEHTSNYFDHKDYTYFTRAVFSSNKNVYLIGESYDFFGGYLETLIIQKIDSNGKQVWEKTFQNEDYYSGVPNGVVEAKLSPDGSLIILSRNQSMSLPGHHGVDTTGDFAGDGESARDVMVMKVSEDGDIVWTKFIGGNRADHATGLAIDSAGNIIISGTTYSADGDFLNKRRVLDSVLHKRDTSVGLLYYQACDAFIAKLSSSGELLHLKCFGGSKFDNFSSIIVNGQYGYFIAGSTESDDFDVPNNSFDSLTNWFVKIDTLFNLVEAHCIDISSGSIYYPEDHFLRQKKDGNLLYSNERISYLLDTSGNTLTGPFTPGISKDDYLDESGNLYKRSSGNDSQITKYDSLFNLVWVKKIPVSGLGHFEAVSGNGRNNLFFLGTIRSDHIEEPYYKHNAFAINYSDTYNYVAGTIYIDANQNNVYDSNEKLITSLKITAVKNGIEDMSVVSNTNGQYHLPLDSGLYTIQISTPLPYYTITPSFIQIQFPGFDKVDTIHFALQPIGAKNDVSVNLLPLSIARPGFETRYRIVGYNKGTVAIYNVQVKMLKDSRINFLSSVPAIHTKIGDTLTWNIGTVQPLDSFFIDVHCRIAAPPVVNNADTLRHAAFILPVTGDETTLNNQVQVAENVQGSYDPNDKTETHGGVITPAQVAGNEYLTYLIRFQNTGTDTAFNVMIRDTLQNKLNWGSFEMIAASHPYQLYMIRPDVLEWSFPNILLPDSNRNEPASHGFIAYRIKPQSNLNVGDTVLNRAHIYFDYNLPVITNDAETIVRNQLVTAVANKNRPANELLLFPNPANGQITVQWKGRITGAVSLRLYDALGKLLYQKEYGMQPPAPYNEKISIQKLHPGLYVVSLQIGRDIYTARLLVQ